MVNVPGRSRGCATCRKRKVKCDLTLPECRVCLSMGLRCPGARTEAFFVHAVEGSRRSHTPTAALVRLPGPQPSRATAFDQLFVSHFIESFFGPMKLPPAPGAPSNIWLHELPVFLASPEPSLAQHAIRAASMLSYGSLANDVPVKTAARTWYAKALQDLRRILSSGSVSFSEGAVCAAVMLIHFETWAGTSQRAWVQHVRGAAMLLEAGGPERCRSGFLHQIFSHLRFQTFVAAMAENELSIFASPEWMAIPFEVHPKLVFDQLIDVLFSVQRCLVVANQLITSTGAQADDLTRELDKLIQDAMVQIHQWRSGCIWSGSFKDAQSTQTFDLEQDSNPSCHSKEWLLPYATVPAAALSSLYDAANIIILGLSLLVTPSASHDLHVQQHAQSILSANNFINAASGPAPDRGSIMMVLQLKVVSLWSSCLQQRDAAARVLQGERVQGGGLSDISTISHQYFADVATYILHRHGE